MIGKSGLVVENPEIKMIFAGSNDPFRWILEVHVMWGGLEVGIVYIYCFF